MEDLVAVMEDLVARRAVTRDLVDLALDLMVAARAFMGLATKAIRRHHLPPPTLTRMAQGAGHEDLWAHAHVHRACKVVQA